jgi:hypothetical protein
MEEVTYTVEIDLKPKGSFTKEELKEASKFFDAIKNEPMDVVEFSIMILKQRGYKIMKQTTDWKEI